jgi:hypothetical protein
MYALRNDVGPSRYDLLAVNRFLGDPARPYGRVDLGTDDAFMLRGGWYAPEREAAVTFRWAEQRSELLVPLDHAADLRIQVRLRALPASALPPQELRIEVNGALSGTLPVGPDWQTLEADVPRAVWRAGANHVSLVFAWAARPVDLGLGADTRSLAAAVDYLRVEQIGH